MSSWHGDKLIKHREFTFIIIIIIIIIVLVIEFLLSISETFLRSMSVLQIQFVLLLNALHLLMLFTGSLAYLKPELILLLTLCNFYSLGSGDSSVGIATGYGLDDRGVGVRVAVRSRIFSSPRRPDRLWDPPKLLPNGHRGPIPQGLSGWGVKLTTHLQLMPRSRKHVSIHPTDPHPYAFMA
jgi:hypothetical protein